MLQAQKHKHSQTQLYIYIRTKSLSVCRSVGLSVSSSRDFACTHAHSLSLSLSLSLSPSLSACEFVLSSHFLARTRLSLSLDVYCVCMECIHLTAGRFCPFVSTSAARRQSDHYPLPRRHLRRRQEHCESHHCERTESAVARNHPHLVYTHRHTHLPHQATII